MADKCTYRLLGWLGRILLGIVLLLNMSGKAAYAAEEADHVLYRNETTGYEVYVYDQAQVLSELDAERLAEQMKELTQYGNAVFWSVQDNPLSVSGYAEAHYLNLYGDESGILVVLDLGKERAGVYSTGRIGRAFGARERERLASSLRRSIKNGSYAPSAQVIFSRALSAVEGEFMARVTKYACNALIALILAMLINFVAVNLSSRPQWTSDSELLEATLSYFDNTEPEVEFVTTVDHYKPNTGVQVLEQLNKNPFDMRRF
ncbi:MAG: hypothetical protein IJ747_09350 [Lachnospiraceae bacterium]|nr:hypothetical protein [Lachnospiraceae bacterium]